MIVQFILACPHRNRVLGTPHTVIEITGPLDRVARVWRYVVALNRKCHCGNESLQETRSIWDPSHAGQWERVPGSEWANLPVMDTLAAIEQTK